MPAPSPPALPERVVPRYWPAQPFPAYRYLPGRHPHPVRDPDGHSYDPALRARRHADWDVGAWSSIADWLWGVDLFNAFYFWEAHEAWEGLWFAKPRESLAAVMLQGLIQVAAALLKIRLESLVGAAALSRAGLEKLARVASASPTLLGLDVVRAHAEFVNYFRPLDERTLPPMDASVPLLTLSGASAA